MTEGPRLNCPSFSALGVLTKFLRTQKTVLAFPDLFLFFKTGKLNNFPFHFIIEYFSSLAFTSPENQNTIYARAIQIYTQYQNLISTPQLEPHPSSTTFSTVPKINFFVFYLTSGLLWIERKLSKRRKKKEKAEQSRVGRRIFHIQCYRLIMHLQNSC